METRGYIWDALIIATGLNDRHLHSLAEEIDVIARASGEPPLRTDGDHATPWVIVDLGHLIIHLQTPSARELYNLDKLWGPHFTDEPLALTPQKRVPPRAPRRAAPVTK